MIMALGLGAAVENPLGGKSTNRVVIDVIHREGYRHDDHFPYKLISTASMIIYKR